MVARLLLESIVGRETQLLGLGGRGCQSVCLVGGHADPKWTHDAPTVTAPMTASGGVQEVKSDGGCLAAWAHNQQSDSQGQGKSQSLPAKGFGGGN